MRVHGRRASNIGNSRGNNEDYALVDNELGLYIVCDGVGGHNAGEVASELAAQTIHSTLLAAEGSIAKARAEGDLGQIELQVAEALAAAGAAVHGAAMEDADRRGMGTTATALLFVGSCAVMGHVGDSRLYLHRGGHVDRLSTDHTFVTELMSSGVLTSQQALLSPYRNLLTRALGKERTVRADTLVIEVMDGDEFVLCSDGFSNYLRDDQELSELLLQEPSDPAAALVTTALDRGGADNITAVTVKVTVPMFDTAELLRSSQVQVKIEAIRAASLFDGLSMKQIAKLMQIGVEHPHARGSVIIREHELLDRLVIVLVGSVGIYLEDTKLATLGPGSHVGEIGFLTRQPTSATVVAEENCMALHIPYVDLELLLKKEPRLGQRLTRNIAEHLSLRLVEANRQLIGDNVESTLLDISLQPLI
jgi:serine/threonine protein phosphatase PrpC/CRP-like cAMP-binding protein